MRNRLIFILLLCASVAAAQVPSVTGSTLVQLREGNNAWIASLNTIFGAIDVDLTSGVTGILPVANGGTGLSTLAANRIPYGNGTSAFQSSANLTFNGTNLAVGGVTAVSMIEGPSSSTNSTLKIGKAEIQSFTGGDANILLTSNAYYNSAWRYRANGFASVLQLFNGDFEFYTSTSSGTAGGTFTATRLLTGSPTGYINVGNVAAGTIASKLGVRGAGATSSTSSLNVQNSAGNPILYGRDDLRVGIGTSTPLSGLHYYTSENAYGAGLTIENNNAGANAQARIHLFGTSGTDYTSNGSALYYWVPNNTLGFWNYENGPIRLGTNNTERFSVYSSGEVGVGVYTTSYPGRLSVKGAGSTSGTNTAVFENSSGTDILTVRDDGMSAFGTSSLSSTIRLIVRGSTADATAEGFEVQSSAGTPTFSVDNSGAVSVGNAAYQEKLTVNGKVRSDGLVLNSASDVTTDGHVIYNNASTNSGYFTIGDNGRAMAFIPAMIERHIIDYAVDWTTGRKGAFWTVPARFDGWKIAKAYIEVTSVGSGAGDDVVAIEIGGVTEGEQYVTAGTHTLVMDDVINTDDVITFNVTAISATPAKGLHISLELSKQ